MRLTRAFIIGGAVVWLVAPDLAQAADGTLMLTVGGEGFDGPPKFEVAFGGKVVGSGTVGNAIDTAAAGRFADAADKTKYVQSFSFPIPAAAFAPDADVTVKLLNEAHGVPGSPDDRALYVSSISVDGAKVPGDRFGMKSSLGVEPTALLGDYLVVTATGIEGVASAPSGGWPKPGDIASAIDTPAPSASTDTDAKPAAEQVSAASAAPATGDKVATDAPSKMAEAVPVPASLPAKTADAAPVPAPSPPAAAAADTGNPNPEGEADCALSRSFQITGFNENSNDLTPRVRRALDVVVKAIGPQKCVVHLTGYSSTEGDFAHNALFSIERSQNALHYLAAQGVRFRHYSANGVGETMQFGADPNANRRVVVVISP